MSGQISIRTIRSIPEIEEIRGLWRSWQYHPNSDVDFFLTIVRHRSEIVRPHILVLCRDDRPEAMLIGRLESAQIPLKVGYRTLSRLRARQLTFIYGGLIGNPTPDNCRALLAEVLRSLTTHVADLALFSHLDASSPLFELATSVPGLWSRGHSSQIRTHRATTVPSSVDQLYGRFSGKKRRNLKQQAIKLLRDFPGGVHIRTFRLSSDLDIVWRDIEEVARKTYQRGLRTGFQDTQEIRSRMRLAAHKNWLYTYILYISGRPCAFFVGTLYGDVFHGDFMGYDRAFAKYSPGTYLVLSMIESFCKKDNGDQVREIDWGFGDAQYKEILGDREWAEGSVSVYAPTWAGFCLNAAITAPALIDGLAKDLLARAGLLQRVKTLWRKRIGGAQRDQLGGKRRQHRSSDGNGAPL